MSLKYIVLPSSLFPPPTLHFNHVPSILWQSKSRFHVAAGVVKREAPAQRIAGLKQRERTPKSEIPKHLHLSSNLILFRASSLALSVFRICQNTSIVSQLFPTVPFALPMLLRCIGGRFVYLCRQTEGGAGDDRHLDSLRLSVDKSQKEPGKEGRPVFCLISCAWRACTKMRPIKQNNCLRGQVTQWCRVTQFNPGYNLLHFTLTCFAVQEKL